MRIRDLLQKYAWGYYDLKNTRLSAVKRASTHA